VVAKRPNSAKKSLPQNFYLLRATGCDTLSRMFRTLKRAVTWILSLVGAYVVITQAWDRYNRPAQGLLVTVETVPFRMPPQLQAEITRTVKTLATSSKRSQEIYGERLSELVKGDEAQEKLHPKVRGNWEFRRIVLSDEACSEKGEAHGLTDAAKQVKEIDLRACCGRKGYTRMDVRNIGDVSLNDVRVKIPTYYNSIYALQRPDNRGYDFGTVPSDDVIKVGILNRKERAFISVWTSEEMTPWNLEKIEAQHTDADGRVVVLGQPGPMARFIEDYWRLLPGFVALAWMLWVFIGSDLAKEAARRKQEAVPPDTKS
jgi:hypothetical protein